MLATYVDVQLPFNANGSLPKVQKASLYRRAFQHEILTIDTRNTSGLQARIRSGDPVSAILRGQGDSPVNFVGYVENSRENKNIDGGEAGHRQFTYTCVGATWVMKNARSRSWTNTTLSSVARQVIAEYNLTADVEDSTTVLPNITQANESDWAFLCRVAKQFGYVVYPEGVTVHFHTWDFFATHKRSTARILHHADRQSGSRSQIRWFKPVISDTSPTPDGQRGQKIIEGIDPRTGLPWSFKHNGIAPVATRTGSQEAVFLTRSNIPADTADEAAARLLGSQDSLRWQQRAKAACDGYSDTLPSTQVYLDGLQGEYDGYWTVLGAVLHWDTLSSVFTMDVELGTDTVGVSIFPAPDPRRPMDQTFLGGRNIRVPKAYLNSDGLQDVKVLQSRGGPVSVVWRSTLPNLDAPAEETRLPGWIRNRWRQRSGT